MKRSAKKIEEFLIGKKVDKKLITDCSIDFNNTNLFNPLSILSKGGNGLVRCGFIKGDERLGDINIHFNFSKNGLNTRVEASQGVLGALARESNIVNETLDL